MRADLVEGGQDRLGLIESEENKEKVLDDFFGSLLHNIMTAKIRVNHLEVGQ